MSKSIWLFILFIHLSISQPDGDLAPRNLEVDKIVGDKKAPKTWGMIFPGTKWCGQGNKAKHEEDFGRQRLTDKCCKNHDRCPDKIKSGKFQYGLHNDGSTTILSCECDEQFYNCLKGVRTVTSRTVGILYFDMLKRKCFTQKEDGVYHWDDTRSFSANRLIKWISKHV